MGLCHHPQPARRVTCCWGPLSFWWMWMVWWCWVFTKGTITSSTWVEISVSSDLLRFALLWLKFVVRSLHGSRCRHLGLWMFMAFLMALFAVSTGTTFAQGALSEATWCGGKSEFLGKALGGSEHDWEWRNALQSSLVTRVRVSTCILYNYELRCIRAACDHVIIDLRSSTLYRSWTRLWVRQKGCCYRHQIYTAEER